MRLLFLGTSAGAPTRSRNVTALALREDQGKGWYLIDCGEATQHQVLRTPLSLMALKAIFITHKHGDHCYGLPGLLASASMSGRKAPLTLVAPLGVWQWLQATSEFAELYLSFDLHFVDCATLPQLEFGELRTATTELSHRVPSFAYSFTHQGPGRLDTERLDADGIPRGPLWNQIQQGTAVEYQGQTLDIERYRRHDQRARTIVIGGDNDTPELLTDACREADLLVHEATYTRAVAERMDQNYGHSTAERIAKFAAKVGLPNLLLTHFSPRYQPHAGTSGSIDEIAQETAEFYSGNLFLAEDFAEFELSSDGVLKRLD